MVVNLVKIRWSNNEQSAHKDAIIQIIQSEKMGPECFRVMEKKDDVLIQPLKDCFWLEDSSHDGVASIETPIGIVVIFYDPTKKAQPEFIRTIYDKLGTKSIVINASALDENNQSSRSTEPRRTASLTPRSQGSPTPHNFSNQIEVQEAIKKLSEAIEEKHMNQVEPLAKQLAFNKVTVNFNIAPHVTQIEQQNDVPNYLKLKLVIESSSSRPIDHEIVIPYKTTLQQLIQTIILKMIWIILKLDKMIIFYSLNVLIIATIVYFYYVRSSDAWKKLTDIPKL
ncbi:unnamed protein product [Didymodactylos carnosus]|uniref:Uncharacterized protein n=1 Tax=Didymodactylos carnosus TaxID=1234261 RepID=A0A814BAS0_9BILA|nr:unnamed protein product [Didymodactylos carnosus]CAF1105803.1 unnamed protein product [Didymodactylos carnosus]CAF3703043.1 unnamed protein product [Didymodactylos carnosus]CAF3869085.1 unnamed protein product [Didymodactylos carnosus]